MAAKSKKKAIRTQAIAARKRVGKKRNSGKTRAVVSRIVRQSQPDDVAQLLRTEISTYHEEVLAQNEHLRELQGELEKSHDRYARLYDEAPVGYVTLDRNGIIEKANLTSTKLFGSQRTGILRRPLLVFVHPEDRPAFLNFLLVCRANAAPKLWLEVRVRRSNGDYTHVQLSSVGVMREAGAGMVYLTALTDVSGRVRMEQERRKAEEQIVEAMRQRSMAQAASEAKDRFLAIVSHEMRTPLSAILLWTKLLRSGPLGDADMVRGALNAINTSAEAQKELIEDLLDLSRITVGKLRLQMREVELVQVVRDALRTIEPTAEAKHLMITAMLDPTVGAVRVDPDRLRQIVWNLLTNAVKFTPAHGNVKVEVRRAETEVIISVSDSGQGIEADFLPYVFESFSQADPSDSRKQGGIGVGLTIVKQLVELHGGSISAESKGLGFGAMFTARLPLPELSQRFSGKEIFPQMAAISERASLTGRTVMIVEDNAETRSAIATLLRHAGLNVTEAASAAAALRSIEQCPPQLLISDIGLPGTDGYALIRRLRTQEMASKNPPVRAVALTAFARETDRQMAIDAGFQKHIGKPVDPTHLLTALAELVEEK